MAVSHVKSNLVADFTGTVTVFNSAGATTTVAASNLVVPSDWNSVHNQFYTLGGNTLNASTASGTNVVFAGSGGISLGGSTGTIVISAAAPLTLSSYVAFEAAGGNSSAAPIGNGTSGIVSLFPVSVNEYVNAGMMQMIMNFSFTTLGTSSGRQSGGIRYGMYSRGTGANSTTLGTVDSASFSWAITGNNSSYTFSAPTSTNFASYTYSTTNSSGVNISSGYTGSKLIQFPVSVLMSPAVYWIGLIATASTSSVNVGLSASLIGGSLTQTALAPLGSFSSNYTTGTNMAGNSGGPWAQGHGSLTTANLNSLPDTIALSNISAGLGFIPHMKFWST